MEWPLFKNFRETKEFKATYRSIFGEDFGYVEDRPQKLEELIENIRLMKLEAEENQKNEEMKSKEE